MYRSWWAQRRVDGVFLVDLQVGDRRVAVLEELRMPAVVIGTPAGAGLAARRLAGRRGRDPGRGRVPGRRRAPADRPGYRHPPALAHQDPHRRVPRGRAGRRAGGGADGRRTTPARTEPRPRSGCWRTGQPPTAIVYDNDLMAVSGLGAAQQKGVRGARRAVHRGLGRLRVLRGCPPAADRADPGRRRLRRARRAASWSRPRPGPRWVTTRSRRRCSPSAAARASRPARRRPRTGCRLRSRRIDRDLNDTASPLHRRARKA